MEKTNRTNLPLFFSFFFSLLLLLSLSKGEEYDDPKYKDQYYLQSEDPASIHIQGAWKGFVFPGRAVTGTGVTIAVISQSMNRYNMDIKDFRAEESLLAQEPNAGDSLGTHLVSAAAGAANNHFCVVGVAYTARYIFLELSYYSSPSEDVLSEMQTRRSDIVDVYLNDFSSLSLSVSSLAPAEPIWLSSVKHLISEGRDGLGTIIVNAVGNGDSFGNCNFNRYYNLMETITVGGVLETTKRAPYSSICSAMHVVAPSCYPRADGLRCPEGRYTNETESAAAIVAGGGGLIL
mmetsp:Transcript_35813/g.49040  ORF Transcript_35813/g.49040 Transcript_35813/m.49040 type:complete len:291 (+) Transcript_35813:116-988(+)